MRYDQRFVLDPVIDAEQDADVIEGLIGLAENQFGLSAQAENPVNPFEIGQMRWQHRYDPRIVEFLIRKVKPDKRSLAGSLNLRQGRFQRLQLVKNKGCGLGRVAHVPGAGRGICSLEGRGPSSHVGGQSILPRRALGRVGWRGQLELGQDARVAIFRLDKVRFVPGDFARHFRGGFQIGGEIGRRGKILVVGRRGRNQPGAIKSIPFGFPGALVALPGVRAAPILFGEKQGRQRDERRQHKERFPKESFEHGRFVGWIFHKASGSTDATRPQPVAARLGRGGQRGGRLGVGRAEQLRHEQVLLAHDGQ